MNAPLSWLKEYTDINVDTKQFIDAMTMSGSKVEAVTIQGDEIQNVVVGKILEIEKHPNADKLQVTKVDIGGEIIQVITGAQNISVGDHIPVCKVGSTLPGGIKINKGKLRGIESCGMMCSIQELGVTKEEYPHACENGIFILEDKPEIGMDIKDYLGINETVFEFEITSNRPDCLSMEGLAREAAITFGSEFRPVKVTVKEEGKDISEYAKVEILDSELCPRYSARVVTDVKIGPSPKWMRNRLKAAGVRPINNIVDITNYVMLEMGQPMHAFDMRYLDGNQIIVRRASDGEIMKTLDGQERKLDSSMLVISDKNKAVALAGVMGGENSEVKDDTTTILFESANFNPLAVRFAAKKVGLRTEASSRYEKGLDVTLVERALDRAAQLVETLACGTVCKGVIDVYPNKPETKTIPFRPDRINSLVGINAEESFMVEILTKLGCKVDLKGMTVTPPSFRPDLEREADIAEEIARFYGYDKIVPTLLSGKGATQGRKTYKQKIVDIIGQTMIACGLSETYTYSFTSTKVFDLIRLPEDSSLRKAVVITNPLGEDYSIMRTTTIPDMLKVLGTNYNRRVDSASLYEISKVYIPKDDPKELLPDELLKLTLGLYGDVDFYDIKGIVEELVDRLGIKSVDFNVKEDCPVLHPGRAASLIINGSEAGFFGEVHPEVSENFETPERTYIGVIDIGSLVENSNLKSESKDLPKFPAVTRDIAMLVKDDIMVREIEGIIRQRAGKILESIKLFDVYKGKQIPDGFKSVAYSLIFRAQDRTLTDEEVNKAMKKVLDGLSSNLDAQLR